MSLVGSGASGAAACGPAVAAPAVATTSTNTAMVARPFRCMEKPAGRVYSMLPFRSFSARGGDEGAGQLLGHDLGARSVPVAVVGEGDHLPGGGPGGAGAARAARGAAIASRGRTKGSPRPAPRVGARPCTDRTTAPEMPATRSGSA